MSTMLTEYTHFNNTLLKKIDLLIQIHKMYARQWIWEHIWDVEMNLL